jgi:hypothetical protein
MWCFRTNEPPGSVRGRSFEVGQPPLDTHSQLLGSHLFAESLDHQREGERRRPCQQAVVQLLFAHARQRAPQPPSA